MSTWVLVISILIYSCMNLLGSYFTNEKNDTHLQVRKMRVRKGKKFAFDHTIREFLEYCKYSISVSNYMSGGKKTSLIPRVFIRNLLSTSEFNIGNKVLIAIAYNYYRWPETFRKVEGRGKIAEFYHQKSITLHKPDRERQMLHGCTYVWNLTKNVQFFETESRKVFARSWGVEEIGENQLQTFSCKTNEVSGSNVKHGDYSW